MSITLRKISEGPHPLFKTVCSNKISEFLSPQVFPMKTSKWIKAIFSLAKHTSL